MHSWPNTSISNFLRATFHPLAVLDNMKVMVDSWSYPGNPSLSLSSCWILPALRWLMLSSKKVMQPFSSSSCTWKSLQVSWYCGSHCCGEHCCRQHSRPWYSYHWCCCAVVLERCCSLSDSMSLCCFLGGNSSLCAPSLRWPCCLGISLYCNCSSCSLGGIPLCCSLIVSLCCCSLGVICSLCCMSLCSCCLGVSCCCSLGGNISPCGPSLRWFCCLGVSLCCCCSLGSSCSLSGLFLCGSLGCCCSLVAVCLVVIVP